MQIVTKKDGTQEIWDSHKIVVAIQKAAERCNKSIKQRDMELVADSIRTKVNKFNTNEIKTLDLHGMVINELRLFGFGAIADAYQEYRDYKNTYVKEFESLKHDAEETLYLGDRENANFDSSLISTKGSLIKGYLTKSLYKQFYLSKEEKELIKRGDIYIHDLRDMILGSVNCCLFDIGNVLKGGFEMSNINYTEPKTVLTALQVIGDITLVASSQQFGGFTLAELDKVLVPYCYKTLVKAQQDYKNQLNEVISLKILDTAQINKLAEIHAWKILRRELEQGFQSLELKLNTVPSSRGDFAFTTITFGHWTLDMSYETRKIISLIDEIILSTREKGHSGKPVVFPKLVFLYDKNLINQDPMAAEIFDKAVQCSSQCMYPDYLSLTGNPEHNNVAELYLKSGVITSPMGCRAYLTPWQDSETKKWITIGRCNIGAVSLNIPVIMAFCKKTYGDNWKDYFWNVLEQRCEVIRQFLNKRYQFIENQKASSNPLAFTQGGFYKGNLQPNDYIGSLTEYMTASFGITALNEASILWFNKSIKEDNSFALSVLTFLNKLITKYKAEDHRLYALYGTPAESLCATQAKQYAEYTGDNQFGEYFTNSFHCHVSEDITPYEKQDHEQQAFYLCAGGRIQYVRIENPLNLEALKTIIKRGMDKGFYQGVNFDSAYCQDCGQHSTNVMFTCPHCGSKNLVVISRVCGYLGFSNINGHTRMNDGKMAEIADRKSM